VGVPLFYALISQTALAGRVIHHGTAFLAAHAVSWNVRHGDFVSSSTLTFMRASQPFHEFGHDLQCKVCLGKRRWIIGASASVWWRTGRRASHRWLPMADGDETIMPQRAAETLVNIAHFRNFHELNRSMLRPRWPASSRAARYSPWLLRPILRRVRQRAPAMYALLGFRR
jgi:hypothetical protein